MPNERAGAGARRTLAVSPARLRGLDQLKLPSSSLRRLAAWVFIGPSLIGYVRPPTGHNIYLRTGEVGLIGLALLILLAVAAGSVASQTFVTIAATAALFVSVLVAYAWLWPRIRGWAFAEPSRNLAVAAVLYCSAAVAYALVFYREDIFIDVFWKAAVFAIGLAFAAYLANYVTDSGWLVHRQFGTPRLQGLLSEPSSWAPFLPALLLLSLERRRYLWTAVFLIAAALTKSPTVLLGVAGAVPAYYVLAERWRSRRVLVLASAIAFCALAAHGLLQVNIYRPLSSSIVDQFVVRLASGLNAVASGGTVGRNDRFASTQEVIHELSLRGWMLTGIGPGSEGYIRQSTGMLPNALPVYVLASFGIIGLLAFAIILVSTVARLRKHDSLKMFLPCIVVSLINSAGGWESYKYVIVAVVVSFGTAAGARLAGADNDAGSERLGLRSGRPARFRVKPLPRDHVPSGGDAPARKSAPILGKPRLPELHGNVRGGR
jgi:hypothetical protein